MKRAPAIDLTEREFTAQVAQLASLFSWDRYHAWLSKHSPAGFPDEVLARPPRLIFAELKSEKGKLTQNQQKWLDILNQIPAVEVYVWRPSDLEEIAEILR